MINLMYYLLISLLYVITLSQKVEVEVKGWDFLIGIRTNFTMTPGTGMDYNGFDATYAYMKDLLHGKYGNVAYVAVMLHEDSSFCYSLDNNIPVEMIVFGATNDFKMINKTVRMCYTIGECLRHGCAMPSNAASFLLTGKC